MDITKNHDDSLTCSVDFMEVEDICEEQEPLAFSNDLILHEIFQYLPTHDLITCGIVNKKWNWNSRYFLREKRNSLAKVQGCRELKKVNDLLAQSPFPSPFNGLFISGGHSCVKSTDPEEYYQYLSEDLTIFTRLKLRLLGQTGLECPVIQFIKKYFQGESPLEQLEILSLPDKIYSLRETFQGIHLNLQNLKGVKFPMKRNDGLIQEVTSAARNLQKISGPMVEEDVEIVRRNKQIYALKEFLFEPETHAQVHSYAQLALEQPKLQTMKISSAWFRSHGDLQDFLKVALSLLKSSSGSLEQLQIGHLDMILLTTSAEMPVLSNIRQISLGYSSQTDKVEKFPTLRRINFQHFFPNLTTIEIIATEAVRHTSWYITNEFRNATQEFVCPSVRKLILTKMVFPTSQIWFDWMKELFPNVREFEISACYELGSYLTSVWATWPDLVQINVTDLGRQYGKRNLDAVFCGMTETEIHELKSKSEEFLRNYQYAPVQPSLLHLKHLRRLVFEAQHCKDLLRKQTPDFLSHLTGHLVWEKMSTLNVQVVRKECQTVCQPCVFLDPLRPFVKFRVQ
ncbi:unnamed protein product [Allacma fusca]|uniref:F-box domain-containing protein n=1 Tax=Allacma fusca TaxID=39272 RepID=A0A8J2JR61_9HEXA|nr:unnamed protein product [Allacma fusca]